MVWRQKLDEAERSHETGNATNAFLGAFASLELCYTKAASERGQPTSRGYRPFAQTLAFLLANGAIPQSDFDTADRLRQARNLMSHAEGFEPSLNEARRVIDRVHRFCARFGKTAADVMVSPVICARPNQRVGELIAYIVEHGIHQFPVMEDGHSIGTLTDQHVFERLSANAGTLDPATPVSELMGPERLPEIDPATPLREINRLSDSSRAPALLVVSQSVLQGIVTKYDLLRHLELD
jgi:predicted transcriptional regulator